MQVFEFGREPLVLRVPGPRAEELERSLLETGEEPAQFELLLELIAEDGRVEQARQILERLGAQQSQTTMTLVRFARALSTLGRPEAAVAFLKTAAARRPLEAGLPLELGRTLERAGHAPEAREAYHEALRLGPNHPQALERYRHAVEAAGDSLEDALSRLCTLPGAWRARLALAGLWLSRSDAAPVRKRALSLSHEAIAEAAEAAPALRECAMLWQRFESWSEVAAVLAPRGKARHPDRESGLLLARALIELDRAAEARSLLRSLRTSAEAAGESIEEPMRELSARLAALEARPESTRRASSPEEPEAEPSQAEPHSELHSEPESPRSESPESGSSGESTTRAQPPGLESAGPFAQEGPSTGARRGARRPPPRPDSDSAPRQAGRHERREEERPPSAKRASLEAVSLSSLALAHSGARPDPAGPAPSFQLLPGRSVPRSVSIEGPLWRELAPVAQRWRSSPERARMIAFPLALEREDPGSLALARVLPVWILQQWQIEGRVEGVSVFCTDGVGGSVALRRMPTLMEMRRSVCSERAPDLLLRGRLARDTRGRDWAELELWDAKLATLIARPRVRLRSTPVRAAKRLLDRLTPRLGSIQARAPLSGLRPWPNVDEGEQLEWSALEALISLRLELADTPAGWRATPQHGLSAHESKRTRCLERLLGERGDRPISHLIVAACLAAESNKSRADATREPERLESLLEQMERARGRATRSGATSAKRKQLRALLSELVQSLRTEG